MISVELQRRKLLDDSKVRQIQRIINSESVSIAQKEQVLKQFIPTVSESGMSEVSMLHHLLEYTKSQVKQEKGCIKEEEESQEELKEP